MCDLSSGKVVTINKPDYDSTKYSTDVENCQKTTQTTTTPGNKIEACDTTTGEVVSIPPSQFDGTRYTADTTNCQKTTTTP